MYVEISILEGGASWMPKMDHAMASLLTEMSDGAFDRLTLTDVKAVLEVLHGAPR